VQRKDVDEFYGSRFEAGFLDIQYAHGEYEGNLPIEKILADPHLAKRFNATIYLDGSPVKHIVHKGEMPSEFIPVKLGDIPKDFGFGVKVDSVELDALLMGRCEVEANRDIRLEMIVSTIKAAHLTMFEVIGYSYVLRASGRFVGYDILGKFFLENHDKKKGEVLSAARSYFKEFLHMVRPILQSPFENRGTLEKNEFLFCVGASGQIWAMITFVRTGPVTYGVLLPSCYSPDSVFTFMDFLRNNNETIHVALAGFDKNNQTFEMTKNAMPLQWSKQNATLD
jgi:hypothetical protein